MVYTKTDEEHFTVSAIVGISNQFFGWLLGFGEDVKLMGDAETVKKFTDYLDDIRKNY